MKLFFSLLFLSVISFCENSDYIDELVKDIASRARGYYDVNSSNFPSHVTMNDLKKLVSSKKISDELEKDKILYHKVDDYPSPPLAFDARTKWPKCAELIGKVRDQGKCDFGWAVATAAAISDRICIETGKIIDISAEDLLGCYNPSQENKCGMGQVSTFDAWKFWVEKGLVSGGDYKSSKGCKPLTELTYKEGLANCINTCVSKNIVYEKDKFFGGLAYLLPRDDTEQIQVEIMTNGPVTARLKITTSFFFYKSGVYGFDTYPDDVEIGRHVVKVIGWRGMTWLCVNSWGKRWGQPNGTFYITRNKGLREEDRHQELYGEISNQYYTVDKFVAAGRVSPNLTKKEYFAPFYTANSAESLNLSIIITCLFFISLVKIF